MLAMQLAMLFVLRFLFSKYWPFIRILFPVVINSIYLVQHIHWFFYDHIINVLFDLITSLI